MIHFIITFLLFFLTCDYAYAGGFIAAAIGLSGWAATVVGFAINMVASSIVSSIFAPKPPSAGNFDQGTQKNPGSRQQLPPAGDNKLPVVYGQAYLGGLITDMSITNDNQNIYWVMSLCEVTNTETGGTPDVITFGDVYWGGKKCIFSTTAGQTYKVTGLLDESTNETQDINGYMDIYLYNNGSASPTNSSIDARTVMQASGLVYTWDSQKLMTNCAFAIVHLKYNADRALTALQSTRFQVTNARKSPGDCFLDYFTSTRYGAAIPVANINTASLTDLNNYSDSLFTYINYSGGTSTQARFQFNGELDTNQKIMQNIQTMADACDCLVKYNEITGKWGVIVQSPSYTVAMALSDTNIISPIQVTPIDLSNSFNVIEVKFPDSTEKDTFNSATFNLATIAPQLLFPNEPVNKQSVNLYLTNNSVTAQYLANRMLEAAREDLNVILEIGYAGLQLEAGDIVTITNTNYGWVAKLFRITKVVEKIADTGEITAELTLMEFNPTVYDDKNITQFTPAPNTGIGSPTIFGTIPAPIIVNPYPSITNPAFSVRVTSSSAGITQYAEVWYSAYAIPTASQYIFAGVTEVQSNGNPYEINTALPDVQLFNIPAGDWYFFSRMVNSLATSNFSPASSVFVWRPTTFQYTDRYVAVAYADNITGTSNFSFNPANRLYYGLCNQSGVTAPSTASSYKWYLADPAFGTNKYLVYTNRTGRKFSFDTDFANYAAGTAAFVPTTTATFDFRIWSALPNGENIIDLDASTGQTIRTGTTTTSTGQVKIVNTNDGQVVASLDQFLDFGGPTTFTTTPSSITVDIYGRVVGFATPDNFYMTIDNFVATSGQTVFSVTRNANYILGQCLVFQNGLLLDEADYTDAAASVTLTTGAGLNNNITIISMRAISSNTFYNNTHLNVLSVAGAVVTWNGANMPFQYIDVGSILTFANTGSPTQYTVSSVNYATQQITFTTTVTSVSAGAGIYEYRAASSSYRAFSRFEATLTNQSSYEPTDWDFQSGYELPFMNGAVLSDQDYDITGNEINHFPNITSGKLSIIQFSSNNLTTPTGTPVNVVTYSVANQTGYAFIFTAGSLSVYANGARLVDVIDYTTATNSYTLTTAYTNSGTILQQQSFARAGAA
jgi:hypothetical protein